MKVFISNSQNYLGYGKRSITFWIGVTNTPAPRNPKTGLHFSVRMRWEVSNRTALRFWLCQHRMKGLLQLDRLVVPIGTRVIVRPGDVRGGAIVDASAAALA